MLVMGTDGLVSLSNHGTVLEWGQEFIYVREDAEFAPEAYLLAEGLADDGPAEAAKITCMQVNFFTSQTHTFQHLTGCLYAFCIHLMCVLLLYTA